MASDDIRLDHRIILGWIRPGSSVLDLGCGDGALLDLLVREKGAKAQGIEINEQAIYQCVARGLSVFHEDIDDGLTGYRDQSFDYVILNQSLQQVRKLERVMQEALRVGSQVIVGFPNFAHYRARCQIFFLGKTPVTPSLPYEWHDTPNLYFLSISDFVAYCRRRGIQIDKAAWVGKNHKVRWLPNLLALVGMFLISVGRQVSIEHAETTDESRATETMRHSCFRLFGSRPKYRDHSSRSTFWSSGTTFPCPRDELALIFSVNWRQSMVLTLTQRQRAANSRSFVTTMISAGACAPSAWRRIASSVDSGAQ